MSDGGKSITTKTAMFFRCTDTLSIVGNRFYPVVVFVRTAHAPEKIGKIRIIRIAEGGSFVSLEFKIFVDMSPFLQKPVSI